MSDDYEKIRFCFKDYSSNVEPLIDNFKDFYPGFIETNYLFIDKFLTQKDDSNNVSKAKKFILDLAIQYYKKNYDSEKIKFLEEQKKLIIIEKQEEVTASLEFAPSVPASRPPAPTAPATPASRPPAPTAPVVISAQGPRPPAPAPASTAPVVISAQQQLPQVPTPVSLPAHVISTQGSQPPGLIAHAPEPDASGANIYSNIIKNIKNMVSVSPKTNFYSNYQDSHPFYLFDDTTKQIKKFKANQYREFEISTDHLTFDNDSREIKYNDIPIFKEIYLNNYDIVYLCLYDKSICDVYQLYMRIFYETNFQLLTSYDKNKIIIDKPDYIKSNILYNENYIIINKYNYNLYLKLDIPHKNIYISSDFRCLLINNNFYYYFKYTETFYNIADDKTFLFEDLINLSDNNEINITTKLNDNKLYELKVINYIDDGDTKRFITNTSNFNNFYENNSNFINNGTCHDYITNEVIDTNKIIFNYNDENIQIINTIKFIKVNSITYKNETLLFKNNTFYYCNDLKLFLIIIKFDSSNYNLICIKEISCNSNNFYLNLSYNQKIYKCNVFFDFIKNFHDFTNDNYNINLTDYNIITDIENNLIIKRNIDNINNKLKYDINQFIIVNREKLYTDIFYKIYYFNLTVATIEPALLNRDTLYCNYNFRQLYDNTNKKFFYLNQSTNNFQNNKLTYITRPNSSKIYITFTFSFDSSNDEFKQISNDLNIILTDNNLNININNNLYKFNQISYYFDNDNYNYKNIYNMYITSDNNYIVIFNYISDNSYNLELYIKVNNGELYRNKDYGLFTINDLYKLAEKNNISSSEERDITAKYKEYHTQFSNIIRTSTYSNIEFNEDNILRKDNVIMSQINIIKGANQQDVFNVYITFVKYTSSPYIHEINISKNESKYYYMFKYNNITTNTGKNEKPKCILYMSYDNEIVVLYNNDKNIIYKLVKQPSQQTYNSLKYKKLYTKKSDGTIDWELSDKEEYRLYDILNNNELSEVDYNTKLSQNLLFGGGNGEDTNEDTNNLLIYIMKNIMLANKKDFNIIKAEYNIMK